MESSGRSWHIGRFHILEIHGVSKTYYVIRMDLLIDQPNSACQSVILTSGTLTGARDKIRELRMALGGLEVAVEMIEAGENLII